MSVGKCSRNGRREEGRKRSFLGILVRVKATLLRARKVTTESSDLKEERSLFLYHATSDDEWSSCTRSGWNPQALSSPAWSKPMRWLENREKHTHCFKGRTQESHPVLLFTFCKDCHMATPTSERLQNGCIFSVKRVKDKPWKYLQAIHLITVWHSEHINNFRHLIIRKPTTQKQLNRHWRL